MKFLFLIKHIILLTFIHFSIFLYLHNIKSMFSRDFNSININFFIVISPLQPSFLNSSFKGRTHFILMVKKLINKIPTKQALRVCFDFKYEIYM